MVQATLDECLSPSYIQSVHRIVATPCPDHITFSGWGCERRTSISPGEFKTSPYGSITMGLDWISPLGYEEMVKGFGKVGYFSKNRGEKYYITSLPFPEEGYETKIRDLIENYERKLAASEQPIDKIISVVNLIQQLERLHPFKDGNTRLFVTLLLNRELVRQGFMPTILENPNRIDGFSEKEMVIEVLRGMACFKIFRETGQIEGSPNTEKLEAGGAQFPIQLKEAVNQLKHHI